MSPIRKNLAAVSMIFLVVVAFLISGAGMNHMTNLYNTSMDDFTIDYGWPVFFVSLGAILMVAGVILGALHKEPWTQIVSLLYVLVAVVAIVAGSNSAPRNQIV